MLNAAYSSEIFDRAADEGNRRLEQSGLELVSTSFIAGFTIVFGIVALGIMQASFEPVLGETAKVTGAAGLGLGLILLVVGRAELFTENFFDPAAALVEGKQREGKRKLFRLLTMTFALNLVGGALFTLPFVVSGVLPTGAERALVSVAEDIAHRGAWAGFNSALIGGALVALLSFTLKSVDTA